MSANYNYDDSEVPSGYDACAVQCKKTPKCVSFVGRLDTGTCDLFSKRSGLPVVAGQEKAPCSYYANLGMQTSSSKLYR